MKKYQDIAQLLDANAITNVVDAYEKGRADAIDELLNKFEKRTQFLQLTRVECIELLKDLSEQLKSQN